jgi:CBS domain-containing protein
VTTEEKEGCTVLDPRKTPVAEIMSREVLTLYDSATLQEAVATLRDYGVSGAPVTDEAGECVGVFSLADLARRAEEVEEGEAPRAGSAFNIDLGERGTLPEEDYDPELLGRETVGDWMSRDIQSVTPETTIARAARKMVEEGIHRLVVLEGKTMRGILTTFDLVRIFAGLPSAEAEGPARKPRAKKARSTKTRRRSARA